MKEEKCMTSNVGFTIICCLLSVFVVLTIVLSFVVIKSCFKKKRKHSPYHNRCQPYSTFISTSEDNGINTRNLQSGVHSAYRHSSMAFPGNSDSFVRMRRQGESFGHFRDSGVQRNASFSSRYDDNGLVSPGKPFPSQPIIDDVNRNSPVIVDENNISLFDNETNGTLKDLYQITERSFSQNVCGKLLVSIARNVSHKGDVLYLDNMGISLHVPEGAIDPGKTQLIVLVLNWDLTDNPSMLKEESLVSPVVYVGPHGVKLNKSCTLTFRHCAFDPRQIRVMRSETEINQSKSWETMCDRDDVTGTCCLTPDECHLQIDTFTLFTCIQAPLDNVIGKKWLQLAVFACPLRQDANHHQMRIYFLNKTNCALQWAIQNEAKFGGKLVCPEKAFLFDGNELDMITESTYVSEGWELVDDQNSETVAFLKIWHGQCPHISVCFRRNTKKKSSSGRKSTLEINLKLFAYQTTLKKIGEMIVVQMFEDTNAHQHTFGLQCNHHTNIQVINYNQSGKSDDTGYQPSVQFDNRSVTSEDSSLSGFPHDAKHSGRVKVVFQNNNSNTIAMPETRLKDHCDTVVVKNIPHALRKQLVVLLDPSKYPLGNDWKDLASNLGMEDLIPCLEGSRSPTDNLLTVVEERNISLKELKTIFENIHREDCAREVTKYMKECDLIDASSESSKVPMENEHFDSGIHGNRNLQTEESSWTHSSGKRNLQTEESSWTYSAGSTNHQTDSSRFKRSPIPIRNLQNVYCPQDNDNTLSKSLFSH